MFQPWFLELVSFLKDAATIVVAAVGIYGINRWRTELTGKAKFEVARKVLLLALQLGDDIKVVRDPFTFPQESKDREKKENENVSEGSVLDEWFVRAKRMQSAVETYRKLHEASWEADILLGEDASKLVQPFDEAMRKLNASILTYFQSRLESAKRSIPGDRLFEMSVHEVVYGIPDDSFSKSLDEATSKLKEQLKKYLK